MPRTPTKIARCPGCSQVFTCTYDHQGGWEFPAHENPKSKGPCEEQGGGSEVVVDQSGQ